MGLGRFGGGLGVTRYLVERGARVLVTDLNPAEKLREGVAAVEGLRGEGERVELRLGEHREADFREADLVVVNPAVKRVGNPYIEAAREARVPITSEIRLLIREVGMGDGRRRVIGVTGTAGKSTVTAMIGDVLGRGLRGEGAEGLRADQAGARPLFLPSAPRALTGGNLGGSLLPHVDEIGPDDWIVLELSSFMLEGLREDHWSPHIAVITSFAPNHLDWHGDLESYRRAKRTIYEFQQEGDVALGGAGTHDEFPHDGVRERFAHDVAEWLVSPPMDLRVPGVHNQINARLALEAAGAALGVEWYEVEGIESFPGLPHRLQFVAEVGGVRFYNDSKSTTPDAAMLAVRTLGEEGLGVHAILGGDAKGVDVTPLARFARTHCRTVLTIGRDGPLITDAADAAPGDAEVVRCGTLDVAVREAIARARDGDAVLLSPACASWDQFDNYERRGEAFVEAVRVIGDERSSTRRS